MDKENSIVFKDDDVALLAAMCMVCEPSIVKRGLFGFKQEYGYYIPKSKKELDIAKDLFANNGVLMETHTSFIMGGAGQEVLRIRYNKFFDSFNERDFIYRVEKKRVFLFSLQGRKEKSFWDEQVKKLIAERQK